MADASVYDMGATGVGRVDAGAVDVAGSGAWEPLGTFKVIDRDGRLGIQGTVAGDPLTHMRLLRSFEPGGIAAGRYVVLAEDDDFATLADTLEIQSVAPADPATTADGATFQLMLACAGVAEYALQVKAAGALTVDLYAIAN